MKQKGSKEKIFWVLAILMLFSAPAVFGSNNAYKVVDGPKNFYYGHISYSEVQYDDKDPVVFREGSKTPEKALVNLPLGPGDIVRTSDLRRCEIQFDNGSVVRLDTDTEFKIETILAPSLSSQQMISNLVLDRGQIYVMFKEYSNRELFQVLTPVAAVKLGHNSVAMVRTLPDKTTDIQMEQGEARIMFGGEKKLLEEKKVKKQERWVVTSDNKAEPSEYIASDDFIAWNKTVNENFDVLHGDSFLPNPVERYPLAVRYFAQKYGNPYGEWLWDDLCGYVWRPYYNDNYPNGSWMPYVYGRWTSLNNQLYWVPEEPWGWVPYHLGIWNWDKNKGWFWIPGSFFAPAWVNWFAMDDFFGWRPWSLFDWYNDMWFWNDAAFGSDGYLSSLMYYGNNGLFGENRNVTQYPAGFDVLYKVRKDQLKKNQTNLPMPKEFKNAYKKAVTALRKGDGHAIEFLRALPGATRIVKKSDVRGEGLRERTIPLDRFAGILKALPLKTPLPSPSPVPSVIRREAMMKTEAAAGRALRSDPRVEGGNKGNLRGEITRVGGKEFIPYPGMASRSLRSKAEASMRIRDFNPDVKMALGQGVRLTYDSSRNGVVASGLRVHRAVGGSFDMAGGAPSAGGWSSGSTSGSGSAGTGSSSAGSSSGSSSGRGSDGGGSGGRIKK